MTTGFLLAGCLADNVARDLGVYVNRDVYSIAELEQGCLDRYRSVTGVNYHGDESLYRILKTEILPVYGSFCVMARKIEPRTEKVKRLHSYYLQAAHFRLRGFKTVALAIESRDPDLIRVANDNFSKAADAANQWRSQVGDLAELHGIKFKLN